MRKNGTGVVILHYAVWAENWAARQIYLDWTGGLWVQMASKNPVDNWAMQPVNTTHPVLNGVQPWNYRDESLQPLPAAGGLPPHRPDRRHARAGSQWHRLAGGGLGLPAR